MDSSASAGRAASAVLDRRRRGRSRCYAARFSWIVLGGVLVGAGLSGSTWRPVFLVNVPVGLAVTGLVPRVVLPVGVPARARQLDLPGLAIAVPASWQQTPLPLGARDPGIVHAHQITRLAELGRRDLRARRDHRTEQAARPAANRPRSTPCIQ